jgi:hypothetical protein
MLIVVQRGVVFFRDQDITLEQQHALAAHYGKVGFPTPGWFDTHTHEIDSKIEILNNKILDM